MELALQYLSERAHGEEPLAEGRSDDDVHDLVLLDTATGRRRRLVERVAWATPRWSASGRRVRFEQTRPGSGFVWCEVDVETGAVEDVENDGPDGSLLPGYSDLAALSPAGQWVAYRHQNSILCVARADGSEVFALKLRFPYFADNMYWSPCGTKLAAHLVAEFDTGAYVIDLRTGEDRRVSPDPNDQANGWPSYQVSGWSPDGAWVVATKNRWHDPKTYDYEWNELWLLAVDGATAKQLTDDGLCRNAAIRPTGEAPAATGEHELTFGWASRLRSTDDRAAAGEALAAHIRIDFETGPPFVIVLVVRTGDGLIYPTIADCENISDGFEKLDAFLSENNYRAGATFTVVLPRYATDDPGEELMILRIAHLIVAETRARLWHFDRDVPVPPDE